MRRVAFFVPHEGCPKQCVFCNQRCISGVTNIPTLEEIEDTLKKALMELKDAAKSTQIAFFGGSFTAINKSLRDSILDVAAKYCGEDGFSGIRFSTRPDCITPTILKDLERYPISHIELGVQSMNDDVLRENKRGHTSTDTINASRMLKDAGYSQTLQMMIGLYKDTWESSVDTAYEIANLEPAEVRIYPTLVLKNTELEQYYNDKLYKPLELTNTIKICAEMLDIFAERDIKVIRLGLHDEPGLKEEYIAGPYHPALRELSEGYRMFNKAMDMIEKRGIKNRKHTIIISPRDISKIKGHGGWILSLFENKGYSINIETSNNMPVGSIELK